MAEFVLALSESSPIVQLGVLVLIGLLIHAMGRVLVAIVRAVRGDNLEDLSEAIARIVRAEKGSK